MAKMSKTVQMPAPTELPLRAWHVITANGSDATVTAHECDVRDSGALTFFRYEPADVNGVDPITVWAFAPARWVSVTEVPVSTPGGV